MGLSGTIASNLTLSADDGLPYVVDTNDLTVNTGATLTLPQDLVMKFRNSSTYLVVNGSLVGQGAAQHVVSLTSYRDDSVSGDTNGDGPSTAAAGDWGQVVVNTGGSIDLASTTLSYGGASICCLPSGSGTGYTTQGVITNNGGTVTLTNATLSSNANAGLYQVNHSAGAAPFKQQHYEQW